MSIDARLNRLMTALTAKERAILVLRSWQSGTPEDPTWRSTMPCEQKAQFSHYIHLMNACNIHLPLYITIVGQRTEQLWLRVYWMDSLLPFGKRLWDLAKFVPVSERGAAGKAMTSSLPVVELPWDSSAHPDSWLAVTEDMFQRLRVWLVSLWQELSAIDVIVDEVAQEFEGEDPLLPVMRGVMEKARRDLVLLREAFNQHESVELPEPDDGAMELARTYFDSGYRLMSGL
jgi:hypothetical protein